MLLSANGKRIGRPPIFTPEERAIRDLENRRRRDRARLKRLTPEQRQRRREADARYKKTIPHDEKYLARQRAYVRKSRAKRDAEMTPSEIAERKRKRQEYNRKYKLSDAQRDRQRKTGRAWTMANKERRDRVRKEWAARNPLAYRTYAANRRARKRDQVGNISVDVADRLFDLQKGKCAACQASLARGYEIDHIQPIALGGIHDDANLQLLCRHCNRSKGCKDPFLYANERGQLL